MTTRNQLGKRIEARRLALGLSVSGAAGIVPVARQTWTAIEAGTQQLSAHRHAGFERALRWAPGSIAAILAGDEPTELPPAPEEPGPARPPVDVTEPTLASEIERITHLPIPAAEKRAAVRALIELWADVDTGTPVDAGSAEESAAG